MHEDTLFPKAIAQGAVDLAKKRGLRWLPSSINRARRQTSRRSPREIQGGKSGRHRRSNLFRRCGGHRPRLREFDINPRMFAVGAGGDLPKFTKCGAHRGVSLRWKPVGRESRLTSGWRPCPGRAPNRARAIRRGIPEGVPGADLSYQTAQGYGACQVLLEGCGAPVRSTVKRYARHPELRRPHRIWSVQVRSGRFPARAQDVGCSVAGWKKAIVWPRNSLRNGRGFPRRRGVSANKIEVPMRICSSLVRPAHMLAACIRARRRPSNPFGRRVAFAIRAVRAARTEPL